MHNVQFKLPFLIHFCVLRGLIAIEMIVVSIDDLVISAKDDIEAIQKLQIDLLASAKNGLQIKWRKCQFLLRRADFLGY